jgi:hypothetical protein
MIKITKPSFYSFFSLKILIITFCIFYNLINKLTLLVCLLKKRAKKVEEEGIITNKLNNNNSKLVLGFVIHYGIIDEKMAYKKS